ncbi:transglutaminase family protein [uncultured Alistipes sp.]|uniref:transglutaminase-like domain-containing protein n=1 Tax=uncultured Alistipes sp. TaxID=538949 RepID=UPI0025E168AC|nr:transglutaminase family protein [uncultured Alistipes sp.]
MPAVCSETSSSPLIDLVPVVYAVPHRFEYEKTQGSMENWESYGRWQCSLLEGRDLLPEELRAEVHRRTDALGTPREKVRALYDYLGETTRYISIQLGIGGLQPMPAEEVFRTKFGDCKALSNYLKACLRSAASPPTTR